MKRLLFCIVLLGNYQISRAASAARVQSISRDDFAFCHTLLPHLPSTVTKEEFVRQLKQLLPLYHSDRNHQQGAKEIYSKIIAILERYRDTSDTKTSGTSRANVSNRERAEFEDKCTECINNIHPNLRVYYARDLELLPRKLADGNLSLQEAEQHLKALKQEAEQTAEFIRTCESLQKDPYCSESNRSRLDDIATNLRGPASAQLTKELGEIQRNIVMFHELVNQDINVFITWCRKILQSPWCSSESRSALVRLIARVENQRKIERDDKTIYQNVKNDFIACCVKSCHELINDPECSSQNAKILETLIVKVQRGEEISAEEFKTYKYVEGSGLLRFEHLRWNCEEYLSIPTNQPSHSIFLTQWLKNVQKKNRVSLEEEKALKTMGKEIFDFFIKACQELLVDPLCSLTGYENDLREALKNMKMRGWTSSIYRELYTKVKDKLEVLRQQQREKRSDNFQAGEPNTRASAAVDNVSVPKLNVSIPAHVYGNVPVNNRWRVSFHCPSWVPRFWESFKEKSVWFLSFTAPLALALGHGLVNNFLAHKTRHLKIVPFPESPWYELITGLSAFSMHALLGKNLYQKLYDTLYRNRYGNHQAGAAAFSIFYLLISGTLQNVGERLPMCGTGWRLSNDEWEPLLFRAYFSNVSLNVGMLGAATGALMLLFSLPDWLEHSIRD